MNRNLVGSTYGRFCIKFPQNERWVTQAQPTEPLVSIFSYTRVLVHYPYKLFISIFSYTRVLVHYPYKLFISIFSYPRVLVHYPYKLFISIFSYTRVLVHYPYMVFLVVFVVITTCLVLSLTLVEYPKFGNPLDVSMIYFFNCKLHIFLVIYKWYHNVIH